MLKVKKPDERLTNLPIDSVHPNASQPRKTFEREALGELAASIRVYGLLQPISVREKAPGSYEIIAGERRYRACRMLGYTTIPALIHSVPNELTAAMLAMIENLQRENLHYFEEAEGYMTLLREHGITQEMLAARLCKNQSTIANKMRLLKLSRPVKERLIKCGLSERHARALLRLHNEESQLKLLGIIEKKNCSVRETESLVEKELKRLYDETPARDRLRYLFRDCRIYVNTIKKAVSQVSDAGVDIRCEVQDMPNDVHISIVLKKPVDLPRRRAQ